MYAYSVDRTERTDLRPYDVLPDWATTAWHRGRAHDPALAVCSRRIVLNPEDRTEVARVSGRLCRRCFPAEKDRRGAGQR